MVSSRARQKHDHPEQVLNSEESVSPVESASDGALKAPTPQLVPTERPGPAGGKRDQNRRERTQAITQAALELFLQQGIEGVTIDDIAYQANIAKGSFYRYFADKEGLVESVFAAVREALSAALKDCAEELRQATTTEAVAQAWFSLAMRLAPVFLERPLLVRLYLQESRGVPTGARAPVSALRAEVATGALELTAAARHQGVLRTDIPGVVSALAVVGAVEELLQRTLDGHAGTEDPLVVANALVSLVLDGVRVRP